MLIISPCTTAQLLQIPLNPTYVGNKDALAIMYRSAVPITDMSVVSKWNRAAVQT